MSQVALARRVTISAAILVTAVGAAVLAEGVFGFRPGGPTLPVGTTIEDYFLPGTQPDPSGAEILPIFSATGCSLCPQAVSSTSMSAQAIDLGLMFTMQ